MANWSKRRSTKSGTYSRTTKTTNSKGGSTRSTSTRVGNGPRVTESIKQQNGKVTVRRYMTEYHPYLGQKRTTKTVYNTKQTKTPKPKKPRKARATRSKYNSSTSAHTSSMSDLIASGLRPIPRDWTKHPRGSMQHDIDDTRVLPEWRQWLFFAIVGYILMSLVI